MKIAVISDLHLGFKQYGSPEREEDFYNQLYKICNEINKHTPSMVIIAGDLFNKPNPSPAAINAYKKGIGGLKTDIICTIKGNHTMVLRDNHYSIDDFFGTEEFEGYYYLDDEQMITKDIISDEKNVQVDGITYRYNSKIEDFIETQKQMALNKKEEGVYRILVVHQSFKEFCGFVGEELSINDIDYSAYDVIICGHIHSRFDVKLSNGTWFIQPGSIERMNTTEAFDEIKNGKGFYLIDTEKNSVDFYKVECDRKFLLGDIKIKCNEDLEKHFEKVEKELKKLKVSPIISYNYYVDMKNISRVYDMIGRVKENILLNKSNVYDETQEDISIEIEDTEIPTIFEAIKMYGKKDGLNDDEVKLAVDIYTNINDTKENEIDIFDNYYQKHRKKYEKEEIIDEEFEEIVRYFNE